MRLGLSIALFLIVAISGVVLQSIIQDYLWGVKYYSGVATQEELQEIYNAGEQLTLKAIDHDSTTVYGYSFHSKDVYDLGGDVKDASPGAYALTGISSLVVISLIISIAWPRRRQSCNGRGNSNPTSL